MDILNLGSQSNESSPKAPNTRKSKKLKAAIGIGGLATLTGVGSTLAAQLTLNNNANVEFGQGVAQTVACDNLEHGGGFTVTPKSQYFNSGDHLFHTTSIQIDGLNLTPQGENYVDGGYSTRELALAAHPGEYYDEVADAWVPTCDGVVLDFSAYTDNPDYNLLAGNENIANPLYLINQSETGGGAYLTNFAFKFNNADSTYSVKYGTDFSYGSHDNWNNNWDVDYWDTNTNHASVVIFFYGWDSGSNYGVDAKAISRITTESMPDFPIYYGAKYNNNSI